MLRASAGDRGDATPRKETRFRFRVDRGDFKPGEPEGGYTGMRPQDFLELVHRIADRAGLPRDRVLLGGDHLGPNPWQMLSAEAAMTRAEVLVADYVRAGFRKIHLDCSMACADDPPSLSDEMIARRAARLCTVAEHAHAEADGEPPVYVIGTEVPRPGGASEALDALAV